MRQARQRLGEHPQLADVGFEALHHGREQLRDLLDRLPAGQREVIRQRVYEGKKFREIAASLDCPLNTALARMHEGPKRLEHLRDMRVEALRLMRKLARYRPRLIGSVWTGHVRHGSDIDIHIFSDSLALVTATLEEHGLDHTADILEWAEGKKVVIEKVRRV